MWQRVLVTRQISSIITSRVSKKCTKALFSTRKTDVASRSETTQQKSFTAFPESLNKHRININTQQIDIDSQFMRSNSNNSKSRNDNYRIESANLLEDLNKRINSMGLSNLLAALAGEYLLWWLLRLLDDGV